MKKHFYKFAVVVLAIICAFGCFTGCNCNSNDAYEVDYNIDLSKKIDMNVLMPNSGKTIEEVNSDSNATLIQTLTGYKVTYAQLPAVNADSSLNLILTNREQYNVMKLTSSQFSNLVAQDVLLQLDGVLEKFGPVIKRVISESSWEAVTVNGHIYGIPERASSDNIENPIVFRQDILNELGLEVPTTKDELYTVLKTIKEKKNIIPLTFDMYTPLVYTISSAFGIYTNWQEYEINGKKELRYYMDAPNYKEYVDFMNKLYSEGLIDAEVTTQDSAAAILKVGSTKAAAVATSLWSTTAIVSSLQSNGVITATQAAGELPDYLTYVRSLDTNGKTYRKSGFTYITAIPFYMAKNAGYAVDWMNSKLKDTESNSDNFRQIVIGKEGETYTYNEAEDAYYPISENFAVKDTASYYLTGTNEAVYTKYWLARVRKQAELARAWTNMMKNADSVGVYNPVDFIPPIQEFTSVRKATELYAQDQFFIMMKNGTAEFNTYLNKYLADGGTQAKNAVNSWYYSR